jgi:hypothetical protein
MNGQPLGREEVARIAIALKGLDEYRGTALNDLIEPAISFLRDCGKALEPEDVNSTAPLRWFSRKEAAKFVTGNPRAKRALGQFNRYLEFVSKGGYVSLWDEVSAWNALQGPLSAVEKDPGKFDGWFCDVLKEKFSEWRKRENSERQKRKAKNSRKKFLPGVMVKKSEPMAGKP